MSQYFVEYLPRLSTTTIQINGECENIDISESEIVVDEKVHIQLTHKVPRTSTPRINKTDSPNITTIRLQNPTQVYKEVEINDNYKWNLKTLVRTKPWCINCKNCNFKVIESDKINKLLPMPSELWYEMVDFWHCHKPNDGEAGLQKRFNEFQPKVRDLIIGSYYFIVNPNDWNMVVESDGRICCLNCRKAIGEKDLDFQNFKIMKWCLKIRDNEDDEFRPFMFITLKLMDEISYSAVRVFTLENKGRYLKIWCFGQNIDVNINGVIYRQCMKIMYQEMKGDNLIEIEYDETFDDFVKFIEMINCELPENLRFYKDWKVSYIPC